MLYKKGANDYFHPASAKAIFVHSLSNKTVQVPRFQTYKMLQVQ